VYLSFFIRPVLKAIPQLADGAEEYGADVVLRQAEHGGNLAVIQLGAELQRYDFLLPLRQYRQAEAQSLVFLSPLRLLRRRWVSRLDPKGVLQGMVFLLDDFRK